MTRRANLILAALATTVLTPLAAEAAAADETVAEILVTAQRRSEKLEDIPISITSTSGAELEKAGVTGLFDLSTVTPGVRVDHYGAYAQPTIRGVGTQDVLGPGASANVAIYVDGFYMPSQAGNIFEFANIKQVDVLKGPQGTLFGQNATGGAILITTLDPSSTPSGRISLGYGSFDDRRASFYGTTGLGETLAADLSVYYRKSDNYFDDIATGKPTSPLRYIDIRSKLKFTPTEATAFTLTLNYSDNNDATGLSETTFHPIAKFFADTAGVPIIHTIEPYKTSLNTQVKANPVTYAAALKAEFDLGWADLTSYTQYRDQDAEIVADLDGTTVRYWQVEYDEKETTFTQELTLARSGGAKLDWVAGLYYYHDRGTLRNNAYNDIFNTGVRTSWLSSIATVTTDSYAAFADGTYKVNEALFITAGARFTSERKALESVGLLAPFIAYEDDHTWERFTPRVAVRYALSPGQNLYASISQGFMSGNYAYASVGPQAPVAPERITQYEAGYKIHRSRYSFDAAAFYSDYKDLQVFIFDNTCACFHLDNAPKAEIYGVEAQMVALLTDRLSLRAGVAYTHARYKEYTGIALTGGPVIPPVYGLATAPASFNGDQMLRAPELTADLGLTYTRPTSAGLITLSANGYYTSRVPFTPDLVLSQSRYALLNLRASWTDMSDHWTVSAYANNVADTRYLIFAGGGFLGLNRIYGPPASYGVRVDYRF